jgi:hypothetical protein
VLREAADYVSMTPEQRLQLVDLLCQDAERLLMARADRDKALAYRDPLPSSSIALLARLRSAQRAARRACG